MDDLETIAALTEMQYRQAYAELRDILSEESRLRGDIARLRDQAADVDKDGPTTMHAVGADMLWRGWVGRMLTELNTDLAKVLARKEQRLARVRQAFNRKTASRNLADKTREDGAARRRKMQLQKVTEADLLARLGQDDQ